MSAAFEDLAGFSIWELFRMEAREQTAHLADGLRILQRGGDPDDADLEVMMRAAHSLMGAAGMVGAPTAMRVAHAMEDCFIGARRGEVVISPETVDTLVAGTGVLRGIAASPEADEHAWAGEADAVISRLAVALN